MQELSSLHLSTDKADKIQKIKEKKLDLRTTRSTQYSWHITVLCKLYIVKSIFIPVRVCIALERYIYCCINTTKYEIIIKRKKKEIPEFSKHSCPERYKTNVSFIYHKKKKKKKTKKRKRSRRSGMVLLSFQKKKFFLSQF